MRSQKDLERLAQLDIALPNDLEMLKTKLKDPDRLVRLAVISKLRRMESLSVIEPLVDALVDEWSDVRCEAASSLWYYSYYGTRFLSAILDHLVCDSSAEMRYQSACTAIAIGGNDVMEALRLALGDPYVQVRVRACREFAYKKDLRALSEIHHLLSDSDEVVRSAAAETLVRLGKVDEDIMNMLSTDPSWELRKRLAHKLVRAKVADERVITGVEQLMREPEVEAYEAGVIEFYDAMAASEMPEEDKVEILEMEVKPLAELLEKARALLDRRDTD